MNRYAFLNDQTKHYDLIYQLAKVTACQCYLELGVNKGETINRLINIVPRCVGVDICPVNIKGCFFLGTTSDFFKINKDTFDIIFIDADHRYEAVKADFANALSVLNQYGIIVLHDTDPISQTYLADTLCSDSYRIVDDLLANPDLNVFTLPCVETGLTLVNRKRDRRVRLYAGESL